MPQTFTLKELARFDGREGRPAYVAVDGTVYDVSASARWAGGQHVKCDLGSKAGRDLSSEIKSAPKHHAGAGRADAGGRQPCDRRGAGPAGRESGTAGACGVAPRSALRRDGPQRLRCAARVAHHAPHAGPRRLHPALHRRRRGSLPAALHPCLQGPSSAAGARRHRRLGVRPCARPRHAHAQPRHHRLPVAGQIRPRRSGPAVHRHRHRPQPQAAAPRPGAGSTG